MKTVVVLIEIWQQLNRFSKDMFRIQKSQAQNQAIPKNNLTSNNVSALFTGAYM